MDKSRSPWWRSQALAFMVGVLLTVLTLLVVSNLLWQEKETSVPAPYIRLFTKPAKTSLEGVDLPYGETQRPSTVTAVPEKLHPALDYDVAGLTEEQKQQLEKEMTKARKVAETKIMEMRDVWKKRYAKLGKNSPQWLKDRIAMIEEHEGETLAEEGKAVSEAEINSCVQRLREVKIAIMQGRLKPNTSGAIGDDAPAYIKNRSAYFESIEDMNGDECREQLEALAAQSRKISVERTVLARQSLQTKLAAKKDDPDLQRIETEIAAAQAVMGRLLADQDDVKTLQEKTAALTQEQREIAMKTQKLHQRLIKLGETPTGEKLEDVMNKQVVRADG